MPKAKKSAASTRAKGKLKKATTKARKKVARAVAPKRKRPAPKTLIEKVQKGARDALDAVMGK